MNPREYRRDALTFNPNMTLGHDDLLLWIGRQGPDGVPFFCDNSLN